MQKGVEEDLFDKEIRVEDGNNIFKEIFKPDYEKAKELDRTTIYVSAEWIHIVRLLKKRLRVEGTTRQGTHFIRRRLAITGLQLLYEDNKAIIAKRQEEYDNELEIYNPLSCILAAQPYNLYPREQLRTSVYMKEETLGWIQDLSEMFDLTNYSMIRVALCYTILKLTELNYLPASLSDRPKQDIALFKLYLSHKH